MNILLTGNSESELKAFVTNPDEPTEPEGGGGFAELPILILHAFRIKINKSYRVAVDLFSEMSGVLVKIGLARLPHYSAFRDWFETTSIGSWRALLNRSVEKRTGHATVDASGCDRDLSSRHHANRSHDRVRALK